MDPRRTKRRVACKVRAAHDQPMEIRRELRVQAECRRLGRSERENLGGSDGSAGRLRAGAHWPQ